MSTSMDVNNSQSSPIMNIRNSSFSYYKFAWGKMWKYFLELLLVVIISFLVEFPKMGFASKNLEFFDSNFFSIDLFIISFQGEGAFILFIAVLYIFLLMPLEFGIAYIHLLAARDKKFKVKEIFKVFDNYWNAVFANLLVHVIIGFGFVLLVIPGIIFACKLSFVSYLIVDEKMDAVDAIKKSWEMTTGYSLSIFFIGVITIFVFFLGLLALGVGVVISIIWIRVAFASVYYVADYKYKNIQSTL